MPTMNLRDLYPELYTSNGFIDRSDEVAKLFLADKHWEAAHLRRMYYHKAQYSLDCHDGMENDMIVFPETPDEAYEKKERREILCAALKQLAEKQRNRIVVFYFEKLKKVDIAQQEGVCDSVVCEVINRGLGNLKKLLEGQI